MRLPLSLGLSFALTVPAGTSLSVRMGSDVSSGTQKAGDPFQASLEKDLHRHTDDGGRGPRMAARGESDGGPARTSEMHECWL